MTLGNDHARHSGYEEMIDGMGDQAIDHGIDQAIEMERERIARELHDELGALLAAAHMDLHALARVLPAEPAARERLGALERTLRRGGELKIRLIEGLSPSTLRLLGLGAALEEMLLEFSHRFDGDVQFDLAALPDLPVAVSLALYRVVQEALTNICKHAAGARCVRVRLRAVDAGCGVLLEISDDGPGFSGEEAVADATRVNGRLAHGLPFGRRLAGGHGLSGMQRRLQAIGAQLRVQSSPGRGTAIQVRVGVCCDVSKAQPRFEAQEQTVVEVPPHLQGPSHARDHGPAALPALLEPDAHLHWMGHSA
jgi:signal transduction histidine kinase